jgi:hypothetical protein
LETLTASTHHKRAGIGSIASSKAQPLRSAVRFQNLWGCFTKGGNVRALTHVRRSTFIDDAETVAQAAAILEAFQAGDLQGGQSGEASELVN